jgi:hypothetical protein
MLIKQEKSVMRPNFLIFIIIFIFILIPSIIYAKVTGNCSSCHTMHNSQNNSSMQLIGLNYPQYQQGIGQGECQDCHAVTRAVLLRLDCLGCHANNINGNNNIISTDGGNWPQIALNTSATPLAGGNYKYVFSDDTFGHNVHGFGNIIGTDSNLGNNPPGYNSSYDPSSGKYQVGQLAGQIMCAGQNGCHGNRDQLTPYLAVRGTHHADDSMLKFGSIDESKQGGGTGGADFKTAGKSYRFLYNVHGGEDRSWEANVSSSVHNEYKGTNDASSRGQTETWSDVQTISDLCAECHGKYHAGGISGDSGIGNNSPWLRHPTDLILPTSIGSEYSYTSYSTIAPVARADNLNGYANSSATVTPGSNNAVVMCLSCHRAHASPYFKIMRWDYKGWPAGGTNGCAVCHSSKN